MKTLTKNSPKLLPCPRCGDDAVLVRDDQLCHECIFDYAELTDCGAFWSLVTRIATGGGQVVVADINIHAANCPNCPGIVTTTV